MGRMSAVLIALTLGAASAVALVACGGGSDADLLPETAASEIESSLDDVARLADEGDCVGAELAVADVVDEVEELREVDSRLKAALWEGTDRLSEAVERCEEEGEETEPTLEPDVEDEEVEKEKKPKKEKPGKEDEELPQEPGEDGEGPELSPQSEGKGEEKGGGPPPAEPEGEETSPSGGVGPGVGVE